MKKRRLKEFVIPVFSGIFISFCLIVTMTFKSNNFEEVSHISDNFNFVTSSIFNETLPILSYDDVLVKPYQTDNINIVNKFYDEDNKESGIIYYNGTYIQNSGILYSSDNEYNVVSILDGEVIDVRKDDNLGYVIEIKHTNNLISSYEGLQNSYVKKGSQISQNTIIGKSGEIKLDNTIKNSLLFELIKDGHYINPEKYYDKKLREV